jgi:hypothetical protein
VLFLVKGDLKRQFYAEICRVERWSVWKREDVAKPGRP